MTGQGTEGDSIMRRFMTCSAHQHYPSDNIKKNEMGGACGKFGGEGTCRVIVGKLEGKRVL
jgi:hypothetical protein